MSGFFQALPFTLEAEGGYTVDQGGPTMNGVTQNTYDEWRAKTRLPSRPVKEIEQEERDAIYYTNYWVAAKCDKLPWPLSMVHFDCAVNTGVGQATKILQRAIEAPDDGKWGPDTQEKLHLAVGNEIALFNALLWNRAEFYLALSSGNPTKHGASFRGWIRRVIKLRKKAEELW